MKDPRYIELSELRIGNILLYKGELYYVSMLSLDIDDEYQDIIGVTPLGKSTGEKSDWNRALANDLQRVPLTEEWLLKFGFEVSKWGDRPSDAKQKRIIGNDIAEFELTCSGGDWWLNQIYGSCLGFTPIQYVHQLQNLYFALTNTELQIT